MINRLLNITPPALSDIDNGLEYYNGIQRGLGIKFLTTIDEIFEKIAISPFFASFAYEDVRYKVVRGFPYIILYDTEDDQVNILRVFNTYLNSERT